MLRRLPRLDDYTSLARKSGSVRSLETPCVKLQHVEVMGFLYIYRIGADAVGQWPTEELQVGLNEI